MKIQNQPRTIAQPNFGVIKVSGLVPNTNEAREIAKIVSPNKAILHKPSNSFAIRAEEKTETALLSKIQEKLAELFPQGTNAKAQRLSEEQFQNSFANPQKGNLANWARMDGNFSVSNLPNFVI